MKSDRRFARQLARLRGSLPRPLAGLTAPGLRPVRLPLAAGLIAGSALSILPLFGLWMLPLGLALMAIDLPALRPAVGAGLIRGRRWYHALRRKL